MENLFFDIIEPIISPEIQKMLLPVKIVFLLVSLISVGLIIYLLRKTDWLKYSQGQDLVEFKEFKALESIGFTKKWVKVKARMGKGWESEAKLAIIEADQLLDDLLKRMGYSGESLGERLKQLDEKTLPNIEQIWESHKIRNNLVHDPDYQLSFGDAQKAINFYDQTFKHLEAL